MKIINLAQGTFEWQVYRQPRFGSSETAAMLGLSTNVSRTELLHMKHTCTPQEFSDWVQINILDYGHEVEAMARPLAESIMGTELYPVTCSDDDERMIASCDGLTMAEDEGWEHKQWNTALVEAVESGHVPDTHMPQVQQQLMVTGATRWLFMVSDGTTDNLVHTWVLPDSAWFERIRAGWDQFDADLAVYEPKTFAPKPKAAPILRLPALSVQIRGEVMVSNLPAFQAKADEFIAGINTELKTDEDFVNADATVKFCGETEKNLELAKAAAIAQTSSIDDLMRTVDHIIEQIRAKRLMLEKLIESQKKAIKEEILTGVKKRFDDHVAALNAELAPLYLVYQARDFAGFMKNKRTLATLHNAVDTELAAAKIAVDALAKAMRGRLTWYRESAAGYEFLFADLQTVIQKPDDDFKLVVISRIDAHKAAEDKRAAEQLARVQAEAAAAPAANDLPEVDLAARSSPMAPAVTTGGSYSFPTKVAQPTTPPTLRLGQIAERLGFALTAEFLRTLGFEPAARDKAACLYHESNFAMICAALQRHISAVQALQAA